MGVLMGSQRRAPLALAGGQHGPGLSVGWHACTVPSAHAGSHQ